MYKMKRKSINKIITILLVLSFVMTSFFGSSSYTVKAEDNTANTEKVTSTKQDSTTTDNILDDKSNGAIKDNSIADNTVNNEDTKNQANTSETMAIELPPLDLEYIYIDELNITSPLTQNIVISFVDKSMLPTKASLTLVSTFTKEETIIETSTISEGLLLFAKDYTEGFASDCLVLTKLSYTTSDSKNYYIALDKDENNLYSYNLTSKEEQDAKNSEQEVADSDGDGLTVKVSALDATGEVVENIADNPADAIAQTTEQTGIQTKDLKTSNVQNMKAEKTKASYDKDSLNKSADTKVTKTSNSNGLVVAIRAGHSDTWVGARRDGLEEEDLTLAVANAMVAELQEYKGVTVLNMRPNATSPYPSLGEGGERAQLIKDAVAKGADVYIDLHFNVGDKDNARGAEVYYPNSNYRPDISAEGKALSDKILAELEKLGLYNRGSKIKNSTDGSTYADGSTADYYGTQQTCKKLGIPGVIVEHAFLSNNEDAAKLRQASFLKQLGIADATAVAKQYGLAKGTPYAGDIYRLYNSNNGKHHYTGDANERDQLVGLGWKYEGVGFISSISNTVVFRLYNPNSGEHHYTKNEREKDVLTSLGWRYEGGAFFSLEASDPNAVPVYRVFNPNAKGKYAAAAHHYTTNAHERDVLVGLGYRDEGIAWYNAKALVAKPVETGASYNKDTKEITAFAKYAPFNISGFKFVEFAVWSDKKGNDANGKLTDQDDLIWYKGQCDTYGNYTLATTIEKHNNDTGVYNIDIYARTNNGRVGIKGGFKVTVPEATKTAYTYGSENPVKLSNEVVTVSDTAVAAKTAGLNGKIPYINNIYRLYNAYNGKHHYTGDSNERDQLVKIGWKDEGVGFISSPSATTVHRLYNANSGEHHYTLDDNEKRVLISLGWRDEGDGFFSLEANNPNAVPVYRVFNPNAKGVYAAAAHHYTTDAYERDVLVKKGYKDEGIAWYNAKKVERKPVETWAALADNKITINANARYVPYNYPNIKAVQFAVWSDTDKANTLVWYNGTLNANGDYSLSTTIANHKYAGGKYNVHIYALLDDNKQAFLGGYQFDVPDPANFYVIMQAPQNDKATTIDKMVRYYNKTITALKKAYPADTYKDKGAATIEEFADICYEEAVYEGVSPEVVFCQAMKETGWLQFGGDVKPEQCNFAGIGAVGGGAAGNTFEDVAGGIRAQVQHLKAYASTEPLNRPADKNKYKESGYADPRFNMVKRGTAKYVEYLGIPNNPYGGGWAAANNYGFQLHDQINTLLSI